MKMRPVPAIAVKAHGQTQLKPGSFHIMLIELKQPLKEGETVALTLGFDDGTAYRSTLRYRRSPCPLPPDRGTRH